MSKCAEHPQNDSIGKCADCGKEICGLCLTALADKVYCPSCIDKLIGQNTEETLVTLNKANKQKLAGTILFWIGITTIIIGLIISVVTFLSMPNMDTPEDLVVIAAGIGIAMAGCLIMLIGAILYFVGRSQAKKQKDLLKANSQNGKGDR